MGCYGLLPKYKKVGPCHKIYRVEAFGLLISILICEIWENLYFVNNCLIKV